MKVLIIIIIYYFIIIIISSSLRAFTLRLSFEDFSLNLD